MAFIIINIPSSLQVMGILIDLRTSWRDPYLGE